MLLLAASASNMRRIYHSHRAVIAASVDATGAIFLRVECSCVSPARRGGTRHARTHTAAARACITHAAIWYCWTLGCRRQHAARAVSRYPLFHACVGIPWVIKEGIQACCACSCASLVGGSERVMQALAAWGCQE